ncbi:hypothetical protein [Pseudomonas fulva]|uniref:hypothetical protein n=1 Tax=Pseudomonas fulva TaxID=47880 RepID=UPI0018A9CE2A|nr:hypothetical protein [Pseudomonas fulva]MBF8692391.1 hypothetical protein [Pseudomonas fulva]
MSNHTPAPWSYWSGYNAVDKLEAQITAEGGDIVIACYNSLIEQGEANACLMAAAPDLLADLEEAAKTLRRYEVLHWAKETNESDAKAKVNGDLAARFERTIDKARGKP